MRHLTMLGTAVLACVALVTAPTPAGRRRGRSGFCLLMAEGDELALDDRWQTRGGGDTERSRGRQRR
jgi:hypothetical protein